METWILYALGSAAFAGLTAILAKIAVVSIDSNLATLIRTFIVLLFLLIIVFTKGTFQKTNFISFKEIAFLIFSGIATGLSWLLYFKALQLGPVSKVAVIDKLSIVFVFIFSVIFLAERISLKGLCGILLVLLGSVLIVL